MVQVLHISNGDTINQKLAAKNSRVEQLLAAKTPDDKIIEEAYLSALSRPPTDTETQQLVDVLAQTPAGEKRQAVEDIYWSLLSGKEFLFNH
jgi:hypothetical protein